MCIKSPLLTAPTLVEEVLLKSDALAVVVVRVQVPELHAGHHYLLNAVTAIHNRVLVVIGQSSVASERNPLPFVIRKEMVLSAYPDVDVARLNDMPSDAQWSDALDALIATKTFDEPAEPVLYGGRGSFLAHYGGQHRIFELPPTAFVSGTAVRAAIGITHTTDFRRGVIYAEKQRFPTSFQCVDVAVVRGRNTTMTVLLGRKSTDPEGQWRFAGGFVDPLLDKSLEDAARREVREELDLEPGDLKYLGSTQIDDWRFAHGPDKLMTAFFAMAYTFGGRAGDDLAEMRWASIHSVEELLVPQHKVLFPMLSNFFFGG
jgi:bifunctional NMN adenylyltransferase/nudix hydrolase